LAAGGKKSLKGSQGCDFSLARNQATFSRKSLSKSFLKKILKGD